MKINKLALLAIIISVSVSSLGFVYNLTSEPIVVYGDSRTGHDTHRKVVDAILKVKPAVVFHTGDLVKDGLKAKHWTIFNDITSELLKTTEFYPALGNHERGSSLFFDNFELPNNERWYSVERAGIHFIVLDSNVRMGKKSEQYAWLKSDLKNISKEIKFIIAILHHPPFSSPLSNKKNKKVLKKTIVPLFEKYKVDMVFSGDKHSYERLFRNNVHYVVTGGGGAPLHGRIKTSKHSQKYVKTYHFCVLRVYNGELRLKVFDANSDLIDELSVKRQDK